MLLPARSMPTSGLTVAQLSDLMRRFGLPPMFYLIGSLPDIGLPTSPSPPTPDPTRDPGSGTQGSFRPSAAISTAATPCWSVPRIMPSCCVGGGVSGQSGSFVTMTSRVRTCQSMIPSTTTSYIPKPACTTKSYGPWVSLHVPMPSKQSLPESAERKGGGFLLAASTPYASKVNAATGSNLVDLNTLVAASQPWLPDLRLGKRRPYKAGLGRRGWSAPALNIVRLARMPRYVSWLWSRPSTARCATQDRLAFSQRRCSTPPVLTSFLRSVARVPTA